MRLTPLDIHEQSFRLTFRGFDPAEVDSFLQRIADELERTIEERDRLAAELAEALASRKTLQDALANANSLQENLAERARQEAELKVAQARLQADRILAQANEDLLRLRREVDEFRERRDVWLSELQAMGQTLRNWASERKGRAIETPELISDEDEPTVVEEPEGAAGFEREEEPQAEEPSSESESPAQSRFPW